MPLSAILGCSSLCKFYGSHHCLEEMAVYAQLFCRHHKSLKICKAIEDVISGEPTAVVGLYGTRGHK